MPARATLNKPTGEPYSWTRFGTCRSKLNPSCCAFFRSGRFRESAAQNRFRSTRVIAASNVDLHLAVEQKTFREDLLYRLNVVPIHVPPLRDRISDIPVLADHFIQKVCLRENLWPKVLSPSALDRLTGYHWPGNVRQLEHAIEMAVTLAGDRGKLYLGDFPLPRPRVASQPETEIRVPSSGVNFEEVTANVERLLLQEALRSCGGNKAKAASILGMKRTTLLYKTKALAALAS